MPYSAYSRFHEVMAEDSAQTVVAALLDHILPLALQNGINVLDIGCGRGRALNFLAKFHGFGPESGGDSLRARTGG